MTTAARRVGERCEVAVVGGGIVGVSCAEALARDGADVLLLEAEQLAAGASGACEGNVMLADKRPGPELELAQHALAAYERALERLDGDVELERKGALVVDRSETAHAATASLVAAARDAGAAAELLSGDEARRLEPALADDVVGGALFPGDLQVWPMKMVFELARSTRAAGGRVHSAVRVSRVVVDGGRVTGLETPAGSVACDAVVVAAGVHSRELLRGCGAELPLTARKGQILVTEPAEGAIRHKVLDSAYGDTVHEAADAVRIATVLETTARGNVLVGASRQDDDLDPKPRPDVNAALAQAALRLAPRLRDLRVVRSYAGFRPALPDALPAIGAVAECDGLYVATGHEGAGICLGPITGELIADLVAGRRPPLSLTPFAPDRFASSHAGQAPTAEATS